jgi:hypothetical protein
MTNPLARVGPHLHAGQGKHFVLGMFEASSGVDLILNHISSGVLPVDDVADSTTNQCIPVAMRSSCHVVVVMSGKI